MSVDEHDIPNPASGNDPLQDWLAGQDVSASQGLPNWLDTDLPDLPAAEEESFLQTLIRTAHVQPPAPAPAPAPVGEEPGKLQVKRVELPAVKGRRPIRYGITTRNSGLKKIYQTRIEHVLLDGTEFLDAEPRAQVDGNRVVWELGELEPGLAQQVKVRVRAKDGTDGFAGGTALFEIVFSRQPPAAPPPQAEPEVAPPEIPVLRAELQLDLTAPQHATLQSEIEYRLEVRNTGTAAAADVLLTTGLPEELRFLTADAEGVRDAATRTIAWHLETLAPDQTIVRSFKVQAELPGEVHSRAEVQAEGGLRAEAETRLRIQFGEKGDRRLLDELLAGLDGAAAPAPGEAERAAHDTPLPPAAKQGERHVLFALAGTDYAVPLANVLEIGRPLTITPTPNVPEWLLGVANLRGDIVSMVDLRSFFGLKPNPHDPSRRVLLVRAREEELTTGLVVDRVKGMRYIAPERIAPPTALEGDRIAAWTRGVLEHEGRLVVVLDLDRLLLSGEMRQFEFA